MSKLFVACLLLLPDISPAPSALADPQEKSKSFVTKSADSEASKKLKALPTTPKRIRAMGRDAQQMMKRQSINALTISTKKDCTASVICPNGTPISCTGSGAGADCLSGTTWIMCLEANGDEESADCPKAAGKPSPSKSAMFVAEAKALSRSMRQQRVNVLSTAVGPEADCSASVDCPLGGTVSCSAQGHSECLDLGIGVFCTSDELISPGGTGPKIELCPLP